jgi:hypothetical protein
MAASNQFNRVPAGPGRDAPVTMEQRLRAEYGNRKYDRAIARRHSRCRWVVRLSITAPARPHDCASQLGTIIVLIALQVLCFGFCYLPAVAHSSQAQQDMFSTMLVFLALLASYNIDHLDSLYCDWNWYSWLLPTPKQNSRLIWLHCVVWIGFVLSTFWWFAYSSFFWVLNGAEPKYPSLTVAILGIDNALQVMVKLGTHWLNYHEAADIHDFLARRRAREEQQG